MKQKSVEAMEELELHSGVLLEDSRLCRLCSEENQNGISLYEPNDNTEGLFTMVNTYLPLKVRMKIQQECT